MNEALKKHGLFSWNELTTPDLAGSKAFYSKLFGWTLHDVDTPVGAYCYVKCGDVDQGGMMLPAPWAPAMATWTPYITVDDVDAMAALAQEQGARLLVPPSDIPEVGRFCVLQDPQGAVFNLVRYLDQ